MVVDATRLVDYAARLHSTLPIATVRTVKGRGIYPEHHTQAALGRAMMGALLLAAYREDGEVVSLVRDSAKLLFIMCCTSQQENALCHVVL
jgi:hypothetical protein